MLQHIEFAELVDDVGTWSEQNFGGQPAKYPLIGSGEELGELITSVLKIAQGIDDAEKYQERGTVGPDAEKDAIGDVVIYLADYAYRNHLRVMETYERFEWESTEADDEVDSILRLLDALGGVARMHLLGDNIGIELGMIDLLLELERFCEMRDYDPASCVIDAWDGEVSEREWESSIGV